MNIPVNLLPIAFFVRNFITVEEQELVEFLSNFQPVSYQKEQIIHGGQQVCKHLYFISTGIVREEERFKNKSRIGWLTFENELLTDIYGFIRDVHNPNKKYYTACTDVEGFRLHKDILLEYYQKNPLWERLGRLVAEHYVLRVAEQADFLIKLSAKERYEDLLKRRPSILQELPLKQIASYLGITLPSLSRIRGLKN
jgi:CRP-like cAMP-binding protein